jgi:hypothetical protein
MNDEQPVPTTTVTATAVQKQVPGDCPLRLQ